MSKTFTPQEMFDLWQKMFAPGAAQMQSMMFPDVKEVERKIGDLQTIENWLRANLGMLQMSIKALEYQRDMLRGGEATKTSYSAPPPAPESAQHPSMWTWDMLTRTPGDPGSKKRKKG
jgi:hypothetical protein